MIGDHLNVTVKFKLSDNQAIAQTYPKDTIIKDIQNDISKKIQIDEKFIDLCRQNKLISNTELELGNVFHDLINDFGIVEFELVLNDLAKEYNKNVKNKNDQIVLSADSYYSNFKLPDFFPVYILPENRTQTCKQLIVQILNQPITKPFVGGYVNNLTSI